MTFLRHNISEKDWPHYVATVTALRSNREDS